MYSALRNLYYRKFRIDFVVTNTFIMPEYPFKLFRGVVGKVLKETVCRYDPEEEDEVCEVCPANSSCPYTLTFHRTEHTDGNPLSGKYSNVPPPYIIYPDVKSKKYSPDEIFGIELTLFGSAIDYDNLFLQSIQQIPNSKGSEGKSRLHKKIEWFSVKPLMADDHKSTLRFQNIEETISSVTLEFKIPLVIKISGDFSTRLPFNKLAERLNDRINLLNYIYCNGQYPFPPFEKPDNDIIEINSFGKPVSFKVEGTCEGLTGIVVYRGNIGKYMPLIRAGEILHVGMHPNYGLGKYAIIDYY